MRASCISHPPRMRLLLLREDYLRITGGDYAAAALLSVFEYWHNVKLSQLEQSRLKESDNGDYPRSLWVHKSIDELREDLLGLYGDVTVRQALHKLCSWGFIMRKDSRRRDGGRHREYLFNVEIVQAALDSISQTTKSPNGDRGGRNKNDAEGATEVSQNVRQKGALYNNLSKERLLHRDYSAEITCTETTERDYTEAKMILSDREGAQPRLKDRTFAEDENRPRGGKLERKNSRPSLFEVLLCLAVALKRQRSTFRRVRPRVSDRPRGPRSSLVLVEPSDFALQAPRLHRRGRPAIYPLPESQRFNGGACSAFSGHSGSEADCLEPDLELEYREALGEQSLGHPAAVVDEQRSEQSCDRPRVESRSNRSREPDRFNDFEAYDLLGRKIPPGTQQRAGRVRTIKEIAAGMADLQELRRMACQETNGTE